LPRLHRATTITALAAATGMAIGSAAAEPRQEADRPSVATTLAPTPWVDGGHPVLASRADPTAITRGRRALAIAAALVPGVVVRGTGSYLVRERGTARRLFWLGAIGVGALVVGGFPVGITGGHPYTMPGVPLAIGGTGLFLSSWAADVAVATGAGPFGSPRAPAPWSIEVGSSYARDAHRRRALVRGFGRLVVGRVELGAGGYADTGGDAVEGLAEARVRITGPRWTGAEVADGTRLWLRAGVRARDDDGDLVDVLTAEAEAFLRVDLRRIDPRVAGMFVEGSTGLGLARVTYPTGAADHDSLLLARFAWGVYLGRRGELALFYDHRRDLLAGGIAAWRAAGFVGHVGTTVDVRVAGPWVVAGAIEFGNAWVGTLAVRYQGGRP
jgi:hypothetical protein